MRDKTETRNDEEKKMENGNRLGRGERKRADRCRLRRVREGRYKTSRREREKEGDKSVRRWRNMQRVRRRRGKGEWWNRER